MLLVECALDYLSMEGVCNKKFESSDRLFHYLERMSVEEVTVYCNRLFKHAFNVLHRNRWHGRRVYLAIDTSDVEHYGRDSVYVHSTLKKRGMKYHKIKVLRFASIAIVSRKFKLTLAVLPVRRGDKIEAVVRQLLQLVPPSLRIKAVLMDKGYYCAGVFKTVEQLGLKYIVPVKQFPEMDLFYHLSETSGVWRWKYTMNERRIDQHTITVYLRDMGIEDYEGFASNMDMNGMDDDILFQAYRLRWNGENSYKESKPYRVKTNSRNHAYRILVYA